ncbi:hypothetical protein [Inconstantimicrobium mannanitabidum]|uniref:Uncharacterized protein n=1 Tax=Inconstantimicrobium mannanitabidum TaxID=1604901 RepID=A0ACB5RDA9_9CLOT|nr:hypothetical protein [Clostridium sp. TW13]GKX67152.1 hypothetical protein rsdtw13_24100 [Clostridium sp. TW13]
MKKIILGSVILLLVGSILMILFSKQVYINECKDSIKDYDFTVKNVEKLDAKLSKQKYSYSTATDKKYITVIVYRNQKASAQQYLIKENDNIDLLINKTSQLVISLPAISKTDSSWNVEGLSENYLAFMKKSKTDIPNPIFLKNNTDQSYDRENIYFDAYRSGSESFTLSYEDNSGKKDIHFNVNILEPIF